MLITILAFIIVLGLVVLFHEFGHFITARIFKVKVHEFGFGYPPRIFGVTKENGKWKVVGPKKKAENFNQTILSLNWIPVGGFVKIKGEDGGDKNEVNSFSNKKAWQRIIMLSSGVFLNFVLCFILFSAGFSFGLPTVLDSDSLNNVKSIKDSQIQVVSVNSNSPAETARIKIGDAILQMDSKEITSISDIQNYSAQKGGLLVDIKIKRVDEIIDLEVIPRVLNSSNGQAVIGVGLLRTATVSYKWYEAIWQGAKNTIYIIVAILTALGDLIKNILTTGQVTADLAGPVGIAVMTGQVVQLGWVYVLQFIALLSVNLGIINILPFPALDGGRLIFVLIEKLRGKEINRRIENLVHSIGFALLMILVVLITYRDLMRWGGQILSRLSL